MKKNLTTLFMLLFVVGSSFAQTTYYVSPAGNDANNGLSWGTAHRNLQTAIAAAKNDLTSNDTILVAKGIYLPTAGTGRAMTITIDESLTIKGSYNTSNGNQEIPTGLAPSAINAGNATILSGDLEDNEAGDVTTNLTTAGYYYVQTGSNSSNGDDNAYNVVTVTGPNVTLNGLFITAGNAYDAYTQTELNDIYSTAYFAAGGPASHAAATATATAVTADSAAQGRNRSSGAGLINIGTNLTLEDCQFSGNFATVNGGALNSTEGITVTRVSFTGNAAAGFGSVPRGRGGAVNTAGGTFNAVSFISNGAATAGGGLYTSNGATLNNVAFVDCRTGAGGTGSGVQNALGTLTATNCTFVGGTAQDNNGNTATANGSAIYNAGSCTVVNSIIDNADANFAGNNTSISYSIIDGTAGTATLGTGMLTGDPMIVQPVPGAGFDLNLKQGSLCINMGNKQAAIDAGLTTDIQGGDRFFCDEVDMGAAERSSARSSLNRSKAAEFDGSTSIALGDDVSDFTEGAFTIEAWVKPTTGFSAFGSTILGNSQVALTLNGLGNVMFGGATSTTALALDEWYHIAATSAGKIYINGKEDATGGTFTSGTGAVSIGNGFQGQLEEVRIWSDVRSEAEIRENMRLLIPCGAQGALVTYQFNDSIVSVITPYYLSDATGYDYDGTISGSLSYVTSAIAVSYGNSGTYNGNSVTHSNRDNTRSITLDFPDSSPSGDLVVSYLGQAPGGQQPWNSRMGANYQYVVDDYSLAPQAHDYVATFKDANYDFSGALSDYKFERRDANATGYWDNMDATSSTHAATSKTIPDLVFQLAGLELGQLMPTKGTQLPVEMTTFTATLEGAAVVLDWQTATEENNAGFEVNRSTDAKTWEKIGFVEGKGTVYNAQNYQFRDAAPKTGVNYYRLRQVDFDGAFAFSDVRSVLVSGKATAISFAPNPTEGNLWINLAEVNETATVQVYDLTGRLLINEIADAKNPQFVLDLSALDNGLYIVQVKGTNWQTTEKVLVKH